MWMTVLLLAITVNFEPTRIGLVPLLLARDKPLLQLWAFLAGSVTVSLTAGFLVLFVFHRDSFGIGRFDPGWIQITLGIIALVSSVIILQRWKNTRPRKSLASADRLSLSTKPSLGRRFAELVRRILRKDSAPLVAALVGICVGLPSVDYLALLAFIAKSGTPPLDQAAALITFVLIGSLVVFLPLVGLMVARERPLGRLHRFGQWIRLRCHTPLHYAGLLAVAGCLLIGLGL